MELDYKNDRLEKVINIALIAACAAVALSFVLILGFEANIVSRTMLYMIQIAAMLIFLADRFYRMFTARSLREYVKAHWFALAVIALLLIILVFAPRSGGNAYTIRHYAIGIYLLLQIVGKLSSIAADITSRGKNPAKIIAISFIILILVGTILLMLPRSTIGGENTGFIDALFTATSATCLTGLTVQDTASHFSHRGQLVILALIQLGALGIMIFGAVFALMIRQAWSARESAAIQDMFSMEVRSRLGKMLLFIFASTAIIETAGAILLMNTWSTDKLDVAHGRFFLSLFHSVSAFCNAGFSLFSDSFRSHGYSWGMYLVICPLIILGGLGFSVLSDIYAITVDKTRRFIRTKIHSGDVSFDKPPKRAELQTRIVLAASLLLIISGAIGLLIFENIIPSQTISAADTEQTAAQSQKHFGPLDALFQSITARTAGFSTVDTGAMSPPSQFMLVVLMLIGGSPGSTAGGIKTLLIVILVMAVYTTMKKRADVQIANRTVPLAAVGMSLTVAMLFGAVLFALTLLLSITERVGNFTMGQLFFEAASALSNCGLSTGITSSLTSGGKLLIILAMILGRLGPLMLLTSVTLNMKPARYSYPEEPITVG